MTRPWIIIAVAAAAGLATTGCLVDSRCAGDHECSVGETCNMMSGECYVQCRADQDCYVGGAYAGKKCINNRCDFRYDERGPAPNFCLDVVNPKSSLYNSSVCLSKLRGKVVYLFFGLLG